MLKTYKTLFPYIKKHKYRYIIGIACLVAVDSAQLLLPQYLRKAINSISEGKTALTVLAIALVMVLTAAGIAMGRFLWRFFIHGSSRRIETALRDRYFSRLMTLPAAYFGNTAAGDLMARATNDMQAVRMAVGMAFVAFVDGGYMSIAILVAMFAQNARTTLAVVIPLPLLSLLIIFFGSLVGKRFKKMQEIYSRLSALVQETLQGMRIVQSFVKEEYFSERFAAINEDYKKASMNLVKIDGFFFPFINFLAGLSTLALVLSGGLALLENRMSPGDLAAMLAYLEMLIWPMLGAGFMVNLMQRGAASLKRINEVLAVDSEPEFGMGIQKTETAPKGDIEFKKLNMVFSDTGKTVLSDISIFLSAGKTLGILGRVGSGKTILLKTLPRIIEAPASSVYWGGHDIASYSLQALRSSIGFVPQDSFLFSDSIKENILFSDPYLPKERFEKAVSIAALDKDLRLFDKGWNTIVGEKGLSLSGGQKQRVAIARAVARNPELLILDDALSAVDTETEEEIMDALLEDRKGKTSIIVSNRVSTLGRADKIAVLDKGKLVQYGSPNELATQKGFYSEIAAMQALSRAPQLEAN